MNMTYCLYMINGWNIEILSGEGGGRNPEGFFPWENLPE